MGRNGINERLSLYSKMSGVANYLCAHLVIPSPCDSLSARYNRYKPVSCNLTWTDLVVMQKSRHCDDDIIIIQSSTDFTADTNGLAVVTNISAALGFKVQRTPFLWVVRDEIVRTATSNLFANITNYLQYDMSSRYQQSSSGVRLQLSDLDYSFHMSPSMLQHSQQIMKNSHLTANNFIAFYVRRGDLKRTCNSDLDEIPEVLGTAFRDCPFYNSTTKFISKGISDMPVILFSDENSFIYRSEVMRATREYGFHNTIDGDYIIREYVQDELPDVFQNNNYITFRIATAIQMQTSKLIQMHGHHGCGSSKLCP
jgi:hypothetical protein